MTDRPCAQCETASAGRDPNYPGLCGFCAWKAWAKAADPDGYWDKVKCIQCALDRDCDEHPNGDGNELKEEA